MKIDFWFFLCQCLTISVFILPGEKSKHLFTGKQSVCCEVFPLGFSEDESGVVPALMPVTEMKVWSAVVVFLPGELLALSV